MLLTFASMLARSAANMDLTDMVCGRYGHFCGWYGLTYGDGRGWYGLWPIWMSFFLFKRLKLVAS